MKKGTKFIAAAAVVSVVGVMTIAGAAFAQDGITHSETGSTIMQLVHRVGPRGGDFGPRGGDFGLRGGQIDRESMDATLAGILGISVEELQAFQDDGVRLPEIVDQLGLDMDQVQEALDAAKAAAIQAAVEAGDLTPEQAAQLQERGGRAPFGGEGRHGEGRGDLAGVIDRESMDATLAGVLGISVQELQAYKDDGVRLPEIVADLGLDIETVQAAMDTAKAEAIQAAVTAGTITQEQADQMLQHEGGRPFGEEGRPFGGRGGEVGPRGALIDQESMDATLAQALGISVEELQVYKDDGVRLPEIVDQLGLDMDQVQEALDAAKAAAIQAAVEAGDLTPEQAAQLQERGGRAPFGGEERPFEGRGRGPRGGRFGGPGPFNSQQPNGEDAPQPNFFTPNSGGENQSL